MFKMNKRKLASGAVSIALEIGVKGVLESVNHLHSWGWSNQF